MLTKIRIRYISSRSSTDRASSVTPEPSDSSSLWTPLVIEAAPISEMPIELLLGDGDA